MKQAVLTILVAGTISMAQAQPNAALPLSVYDGFWTGTLSCSGLVTPGNNPKANEPFSTPLTFNMSQGQAVARLDNDINANTYRLSINSAGQVDAHYTGNNKANSNRAWLVRAEGRVVGGQILLKASMTSPDKATVFRDSCIYELKNDDVQANIERHMAALKAQEAAKAPPAASATATTAKTVAAPVKPNPAPAAKKAEAPIAKPEPSTPPKPVKASDGF
jgi:hypothetical protein